ncbi:unnamed protein product, partial [Cyprideis torosa]
MPPLPPSPSASSVGSSVSVDIEDDVSLLVSALQKKDFQFISSVAKLVLGVLRRCWKGASAVLVFFVLLWYVTGGIITLGLLLFALTGE